MRTIIENHLLFLKPSGTKANQKKTQHMSCFSPTKSWQGITMKIQRWMGGGRKTIFLFVQTIHISRDKSFQKNLMTISLFSRQYTYVCLFLNVTFFVLPVPWSSPIHQPIFFSNRRPNKKMERQNKQGKTHVCLFLTLKTVQIVTTKAHIVICSSVAFVIVSGLSTKYIFSHSAIP